MDASSSWVTVFNGARDRYQVALALAECGRLEALVTDWYSPLDTRWASLLARGLPRRLASVVARRYAVGLPSALVRPMPVEVLRQVTRQDSLEELDTRMGRRAGRLARQRGAGILSYNYHAHAAFAAYGTAEGGHKVCFQVQAHAASMRAILRDGPESEREGRGMATEPELTGSPRRIAELSEAPLQADLCLVPSAFAGATLTDHGVSAERVRVVPYGVDLDAFRPAESRSSRFCVLFVGQLTQRKGLRFLLEAWRRLALPNAELRLVGRGQVDAQLLGEYAGCATIEMNVHSLDRMRALYQTADVFCMPSLVESFGLVYLEALACGTPIIGTVNTGAPDLLAEEHAGFIVPIRDSLSLGERLTWCYEHRDELRHMRVAARAAAQRFSWTRFRSGVVHALDEALPSVGAA